MLSGSNQYSVSDKVICGGVKIQKRDLETKDTKAQGGASLKDTAFAIISLNDNAVLVDGKLYKKNETVKTIHTGVDGIAATDTDTLPFGKYRLEETSAPEGYLTDGAKAVEFEITENGKIVDLTDEEHSVYNQIKRGDIEGVKIGAGTHKRLADVPFRITSKTTGENHVVVTDDNGQFSTSAEWASYKHNTNAGKTSEDGTVSEEIKERTYDLKCKEQGRMIQVSIPATVPLKEFDYNAEVEIINPVADTVATATFQGADVDWYIKADDIVLKNKVTTLNGSQNKNK